MVYKDINESNYIFEYNKLKFYFLKYTFFFLRRRGNRIGLSAPEKKLRAYGLTYFLQTHCRRKQSFSDTNYLLTVLFDFFLLQRDKAVENKYPRR